MFSIIRDFFFPGGQMPLLAKTAVCFEVMENVFPDERQNSPENRSNN